MPTALELARDLTRRRDRAAPTDAAEALVIPPTGQFWHVEAVVSGFWSHGLCGRQFDRARVERTYEVDPLRLRRLCCFCRNILARGG